MGSNNFGVKEFALSNLGKTVKWENSAYCSNLAMIIGYMEKDDAIIVSFTNDYGWGHNGLNSKEDVILLHSPLNVSFLYIYPNNPYHSWKIK